MRSNTLTTEERINSIVDKLWEFSKTPKGPMTPEQDEATLDPKQAKSALLALINEERLKEAIEQLYWTARNCMRATCIEDAIKLKKHYEEELQTLSQGGKNNE